MIDNSNRLITENTSLLGQVREELERLMELQLNNIQDGFAELQRKIEEKKLDIIAEFERKYKREEQRLMNKEKVINSNQEEINNIEQIFEELVQFIEQSNDAQVLQKIQDITTFLHKSFTDLDIITKNQVTQKGEIFIDQSFKPLSLNIRKAMEIVKKFEMMWPSVDQNQQMKIFGNNPQDKLGLYGSVKAQAEQPTNNPGL